MRQLSSAQLEAARRRADKYFPAPADAPPRASVPMLTDDMRTIARYLFGAPMASEYGNVERSRAIDALARLVGAPYQVLADEFDARRASTRAAHEIVREKYTPPHVKRSRRR